MRLFNPFRFLNSNARPLAELDDIYGKAISKLPVATRLEYCRRLLHRCKFDLHGVDCKIKKQQLKTLLKSTVTEISKLEEQAELK